MIKQIFLNFQSKGFFRGLSYPLISYGVVNSLFFGVYGNSLKWLDRDRSDKKSSYLNIYLAGCIGGTAQLVALVPVDLIKVVLQSQIPHSTTKGIFLHSTLCDKVCQSRATGRWFSLDTRISSIYKTDLHDITENFVESGIKHHKLKPIFL